MNRVPARARTRQPTAPARTPVRYASIVETIRREIIAGQFAAGQRLPTKLELQQRFQTTSLTVQRAIDKLAAEGFLRAQQRTGLFVPDQLPHLSHYALVFWNDPRVPSLWTKYYVALTDAAAAIVRTEGRSIALFHGIDHHADNPDRQRLIELMRAERLAGIIFANSPEQLIGTPLLTEPGIARVALMGMPLLADLPTVRFDAPGLLHQALDYLVGLGRSRIAIVGIETNETQDRERARLLAERGLAAPRYWRQVVSRGDPASAHALVELLLHGPAGDRPDGLIILDDNLVDHGLAGLVAAGVRVPDDVAVVVHCNFPSPNVCVLPVKRLGFNIREALWRCVTLVDAQRQGQPVPPVTVLTAVSEEDLRAAAPPARPQQVPLMAPGSN